jgi:hypothetical protein
MFHSIRIVGRGRVGTAIAARLTELGHRIDDAGDLVLLCVPDAAIAEVARSLNPGLDRSHQRRDTACQPRAARKRFGLHPLQTIVRGRGPEQLDGAWAALTGETEEAVARGTWLAGALS